MVLSCNGPVGDDRPTGDRLLQFRFLPDSFPPANDTQHSIEQACSNEKPTVGLSHSHEPQARDQGNEGAHHHDDRPASTHELIISPTPCPASRSLRGRRT